MSDKTPWHVAAERIMGIVATARMRNAPLKEFASEIENTANAAIAETSPQIEEEAAAKARAAAVAEVFAILENAEVTLTKRNAIRAIASAPPGYVCVPVEKRATGRTIPNLTGMEHVCEWQNKVRQK